MNRLMFATEFPAAAQVLYEENPGMTGVAIAAPSTPRERLKTRIKVLIYFPYPKMRYATTATNDVPSTTARVLFFMPQI